MREAARRSWTRGYGRSVEGNSGFALHEPVQCASYSIARTDSQGIFSLSMPAQSVTIYAFHPDYELGARLDSVFEDGTLRYLQTEIVNYRYSRVPKQPDPRWPRALVQDDHIALAPAPLAPDQAHHEYPATLHDVPLGVGQLPVFPLWRRGDAPKFEGGPARLRQLQSASSPA